MRNWECGMRTPNSAQESDSAFPLPRIPKVPTVPEVRQPNSATQLLKRAKSVHKTFLVAEAGLEPARDYLPQDFKS